MKVSIGASNLLMTSAGLLRPTEIDADMAILGVDKNGRISGKRFPMDAFTTKNSELIVFYTGRTELAATPDAGIWGQGLEDVEYLLRDVEKNRYRHGHTLEVISTVDASAWEKVRQTSPNPGPPELVKNGADAFLVASMARRVAYIDSRVVIRVPKRRARGISEKFEEKINESELLAGTTFRLATGRYWSWIVLESTPATRCLTQLWPEPAVIPRPLRDLPMKLLEQFGDGLLNILVESEDSFTSFLGERMMRSFLYHVFALTGKSYLVRPRPLYRAYEVEVGLRERSAEEARILSWETTAGTAVDIRLDDPYWTPLVNLALPQPN